MIKPIPERGVFITWILFRDKNLTISEKFLLQEIQNLSSLELGCIANNNHFSKLMGVKKPAISRLINGLVKKGYITSKIKNGSRNFNRTLTLNKLLFDPKQIVISPLTNCYESKGNKTINKTKEIVDDLKSSIAPPLFSKDDMDLSLKMYESILSINNGFKKPNLDQWAKEFRLMRERDNRGVKGMNKFIESLYFDDNNMWVFWRGNILSPKSMRKNYDKVVTQFMSKGNN